MSLSKSDLDRIRAKLASFPPYDWEDDVAALLDAVRWARDERDAYLKDYTAELESTRIKEETIRLLINACQAELDFYDWHMNAVPSAVLNELVDRRQALHDQIKAALEAARIQGRLAMCAEQAMEEVREAHP